MAKMQLGDISVNFLQVMEVAIRRSQVNPHSLFEPYGVNQELLATPKARISIPKFMRLGHSAITATQEPALGLIMGGLVHIGHTGIAGCAAITAANLARAMATLIHFERLGSLNCRGYSQFFREGKLGVAQFYSISPYNEYNYFVVDLMLSSWFHLATFISGSKPELKEVSIEFSAPDYAARYEELFQAPVLFDQPRNALVLTEASLNRPSIFANPAVHAEAMSICNSELMAVTRTRSLKDRVREAIGPLLQGKTPSMKEVAGQLGLAPWTLRRKLEQEDVNFQALMEETRRSLAESYVRDTELRFGEIAFRLGFSSPAAFHRAFKRWTQRSPGAYRDQ